MFARWLQGEVLELVLQNLPANANNGDYRMREGASRVAQEQHPFHMHGHHFWVRGEAPRSATLRRPLRKTTTWQPTGCCSQLPWGAARRHGCHPTPFLPDACGAQVLGQGLGIYNAAANASSLNTRNPPLRDTATLPQNGWVVLRLQADNPGLWILHCHLFWCVDGCMALLAGAGLPARVHRSWQAEAARRLASARLTHCLYIPLAFPLPSCPSRHQYMGQLLVIAEDVEGLQKLKRPDGLPPCPDKCTYNAAPWVRGRLPVACHPHLAWALHAVYNNNFTFDLPECCNCHMQTAAPLQTQTTVEKEFGKSGFQLPVGG